MRFANRLAVIKCHFSSFTILAILVQFTCDGSYGQLPYRHRLDGNFLQAGFGLSIDRVGDINGDGCDDFVASEANGHFGIPNSGSLFVYSGLDCSVLATHHGDINNHVLGRSVAGVGDIDGDGVPDYCAGTPFGLGFQGLVRVYSGATHLVIRDYTSWPNGAIGQSVDGLGDVNGDGVPEILASRLGAVVVFDGVTGAILQLQFAEFPADEYGLEVKGVGDLTGDGIGDYCVGAPEYGAGFMTNVPWWGRVYIYSGATGALVRTLETQIHYGRFGDALGAPGDIDGDGFADVLVGSYREGNFRGAARLYSGADGSLMHMWTGDTQILSRYGTSVAGVGDVNGDGVPDIAVGEPVWGPISTGISYGRAHVYSGADYSQLFMITGGPGDKMGINVAGLGDVNGDGFADFGITEQYADFGGYRTGSVYVMSLGGKRTYATSGSGIQTLQLGWSPGTGADPADGTVHCSGASPFAYGIYGVSFEAASTTVSGYPVVIDLNPALLFLSVPFFFDGTGSYSAPSNIRHPFVGGLNVRAQFFELSATPAASNGLELRLVR